MIATPEELAEIRGHAEADYPSECCGVILVRAAMERLLLRCRNLQDTLHESDPIAHPRDSRTAYYIDPKDLLQIGRHEAQGYRVAAIYHSHCDAGAYFSETDRRNALLGGEPAYPDARYIVVSVVSGRSAAAGAFHWDAGRRDFLPVGLEESMRMSRSDELFDSAQRVIPGGVNSPVRAFRGVGGRPFFVERAAGARIFDVDGNAYIDFLGSWGPLILGHAAPQVVEAVIEAARRGTSYGAPTRGEVELAQAITQAYPSMEMVRLVSSGTEAAMTAIRLARGATGRDVILKFDGCYHGHADSLLVKAGSGGATLSLPDSRGVPASLATLTITVPFNDLEAVRRAFRERGGEIAAVIVEPVAGNMGVVPPAPGFLDGLRAVCTEAKALLVFDEVITGFRVAYGGAQARYGVRPDLTCLGKIIGGGLPVGAYGGRRGLMEHMAPLGGVYQAGTLSGNPLAVAAGLATLTSLRDPAAYERLERLGALLQAGLEVATRKAGIALTVNRVGSMLTGFFCAGPVTDYVSAKRADTARYGRYFHAMLARGVFLAASQFEAAFVSLAHAESDLETTARAAMEAMATLG